MKTKSRLARICLYTSLACSSLGFASAGGHLSQTDIAVITSNEIRGKVWHVEQEPEERPVEQHVSLFVTSNLRDIGGSCLADSYVFEVQRAANGWRRQSKTERPRVFPGACSSARPETFAHVDANIPEDRITASVSAARELLKGASPNQISVSLETPDLKEAIARTKIENLAFVRKLATNDVELEFAVKGIMPQFLSLRMTFSASVVTHIFVNTQNGVDVVPEK